MKGNVYRLAVSAVVAAFYAALTMLLAPISYGVLQFRISEVLCILPFFLPSSMWGLFVGCLIANLLSPLGPIDIIVGSLATLMAAFLTMLIGKKGRDTAHLLLSIMPPVFINALAIGSALTASLAPDGGFLAGLCVMGGQVAAEEAAVLLVLGFPLALYCRKKGFFDKISAKFGD